MTVNRPKHYSPEPGDEFVRLRDIGPDDRERIFEARNQQTGEGIVGYLADINHHQLHGTVGWRFKGEPLGMFDVPDALILRKYPGYILPAPADDGA